MVAHLINFRNTTSLPCARAKRGIIHCSNHYLKLENHVICLWRCRVVCHVDCLLAGFGGAVAAVESISVRGVGLHHAGAGSLIVQEGGNADREKQRLQSSMVCKCYSFLAKMGLFCLSCCSHVHPCVGKTGKLLIRN